MRRRKCLSHADANAGDASAAAAAGEPGAAAALSTAGVSGIGGGGGGVSGSDGANDGGDADGAGYGKSLCAGKDIQTAECRGEQCQIGKDGKCVYDRVTERDGKTERDRRGDRREDTETAQSATK